MDHSSTPAANIAVREVPRSFRRAVATVVTAALAVGGLSLVGIAPANAATTPVTTGSVTGGTFAWNVSEQVHLRLPNEVASNGASVDTTTGVFTWGGGTGTVNTTTGVSDITYTGSARVAFSAAGTEYYSIVLANPEVTVDAAGNGSVIADVSYAVAAQGANPAVSGSTPDVVVTRFTTGNGTGDTLTVVGATATLADTPAFAGVIAPGSTDASDVGITDPTLPIDGKSFAKEFLLALPSSLRAHFYASSATNTAKAPSAFTATATVVTPTLTTGTQTGSYAGGLSVPVSGNGFRGVTKTGDAGIYVGISLAGGITDHSSANMGAFLGTQWIPASALTTGAFTVTLNVPTAKLDPTKSYSIYTWQAHAYSNASQNTETPITVDYSLLAAPAATPPAPEPAAVVLGLSTSTSKAVYGKAVSATVVAKDRSTTGSVRFYLNGKAIATRNLARGSATITLGKTIPVSSNTMTVAFIGNASYASATSKAVKFVVQKATTSRVTVGVSKFAKKTSPVIAIKVAPLNNGSYATGKINLYVGSTLVKSVTLTTANRGTIKASLPTQSKSVKVHAVFVGNANVAAKASPVVTLIAR